MFPAARLSSRLRLLLGIAFAGIFANGCLVAIARAQDYPTTHYSNHSLNSAPIADSAADSAIAPVDADRDYADVSQSEPSALSEPINSVSSVATPDQPFAEDDASHATLDPSDSADGPELQSPDATVNPESELNPEPNSETAIENEPSTHASDLLNQPTAELERHYAIYGESTGGGSQPQMIAVTAPAGGGETIADIQVRFLDDDGQPDDGRTRPYIITREFDLEPGDVYDQETAQEGLERLNELEIVEEATLTLEPAAEEGQVSMVVSVVESRPAFAIPGFGFLNLNISPRLGTDPPPVSVLQGPTLPRPVSTHPLQFPGFAIPGTIQAANLGGNNQSIELAGTVGTDVVGLDLSFNEPWIDGTPRVGFNFNVFGVAYISPIFTGGSFDVELEGSETAWVHRFGGGLQFRREFRRGLDGAVGVSFQRITVRDDLFLFGSNIETTDELGNELTMSSDGVDDLLTLNLGVVLDERDDRLDPTRGFRFRFANDLAIPVGEANIFHNRLSSQYTQYLPLRLFGFAEGPRTLILNLQTGTVVGDLPPYEAFSLGGPDSVRGYSTGDLGTGRSFVQATAEYRFPIVNFRVFRRDVRLGGSLFADFASDLGSGDLVEGEPAEVREKPGTGAGFGLGLNALTTVGLFRLEFGVADTGQTAVYFNVGDRF